MPSRISGRGNGVEVVKLKAGNEVDVGKDVTVDTVEVTVV